MPEPTQGQEPNASGQEPQNQQAAGTATAANAQAGQESGQEQFDAAYVKQLRAEAAENRRKLRDLETAAKVAEDAKLSETERTTRRLAELERQQTDWQRERQELTTRYAIERQAAQLGIVDPDAAYRLLDLASIEYDEDGKPKDVEKALQALLKQRPYLAGQQGAASAGAMTNPATGRNAAGAGAFTKSQIADRAFWQAHSKEIMAAMAEGRIIDG